MRQFDNSYALNAPAPLDVSHKKAVFESTLNGKALRWLAEYLVGHFPMCDAVHLSFLRSFWVEKIVAQTLERLRVLKQGKRPAEDYAAKFWVLLQRVSAA